MEAASRFKSLSQSTHIISPRMWDCCKFLLQGFDLVMDSWHLALLVFLMNVTCQSFILSFDRDQVSEDSIFTSTCLPSFSPLLPSFKMDIEGKETKILDCI